MRNLIPELQGPEALPEAAQIVLDDKQVAGIIVRDVVPADFILKDEVNSAGFLPELYEAVPDMRAVDEVVDEWRADIGTIAVRASAGILQAYRFKQGKRRHLDEEDKDRYIPGPLAISFRIDHDPAVKRHYIARRLASTSLNKHGQLRTNLMHWSHTPYSRIGRFGRAEQRPGDAIIIPAHPYPALHAIKAPERNGLHSTAIVVEYGLIVTKTVQNANTV